MQKTPQQHNADESVSFVFDQFHADSSTYFLCHSNNIDDDTHEKYVKLHMDILTYHSRVKNKAAESLRSIKAKVGFVPRDVEEHLQELQRVEVGSVRFNVMYSLIRSSVCVDVLAKGSRGGHGL